MIGVIMVITLTVSVIAAITLLRPPSQRTHQLKMNTDVIPMRVYLSEKIRDEGTRHNIELEHLSKKQGSLEALADVDSPSDTKLALIPGGVKAREYPHVRTVATLVNEPLHVFLRPELAGKGISSLRGKRVNLGPFTTASYHISLEVLAFAGLRPSSDSGADGFILETKTPDEMYNELIRIDSLTGIKRTEAITALPDAEVFLAPMPSLLA